MHFAEKKTSARSKKSAAVTWNASTYATLECQMTGVKQIVDRQVHMVDAQMPVDARGQTPLVPQLANILDKPSQDGVSRGLPTSIKLRPTLLRFALLTLFWWCMVPINCAVGGARR